MNRVNRNGKVGDPTFMELAQLRQVVYRFFGSLFLYPNGERLTSLRAAARQLLAEGDLWSLFPFQEPWRRLLQFVAGLDGGENVPVEEEYVRLFSVNPEAIPHESVYVDVEGIARGMIVANLEQEYRESGLALAPKMVEPPDHIAIELEFLSFLCDKEVQAQVAESAEEIGRAQEDQRAFLGEHLGRWFPKFARRVKGAAPDRLYGIVIEAAFAFLHYEMALVRLYEPQESNNFNLGAFHLLRKPTSGA